MIKGVIETPERRVLVLGLSAENRRRLGEDKPIRIDPDELAGMGLPPIEIVIMGGETEESMMDDLRKAGFA